MYLADYHLHASCSPDGILTIPQIAQRAIEVGLDEICITDHLDTIWWKDYSPRDSFDWPEVLRQYEEAQNLYGDRIKIRLGAEQGEAVINFHIADKLQREAPPLDFIIGSVHTTNKKLGYFDIYYMENRGEDYFNAIIDGYMEETMNLVRWGKFHVLGHLMLPLRYLQRRFGIVLPPDPWMDRIEEVLRYIVDHGIGLEINTGTGTGHLPSEDVLRRYRRLGGELITIGSDAHKAEHIGAGIAQAQDTLRRLGWQYFATFEQGKPIFHHL